MPDRSDRRSDNHKTPLPTAKPEEPFTRMIGNLEEGYYITIVIRGAKTSACEFLELVHPTQPD